LQRAARTCELAGFRTAAETDPDLAEWNYGHYEGLRSAEILAKRPDWQLFRDGAPGGESPAQVGERADRVVQRIRTVPGDVLFCFQRAPSFVFSLTGGLGEIQDMRAGIFC
jgi:probable phosphoglycerate mutase